MSHNNVYKMFIKENHLINTSVEVFFFSEVLIIA